jgi:hypothetical protein
MKLQFSQENTNLSKLEHNSIMSLHLGHSISLTNSVITGSSLCSASEEAREYVDVINQREGNAIIKIIVY